MIRPPASAALSTLTTLAMLVTLSAGLSGCASAASQEAPGEPPGEENGNGDDVEIKSYDEVITDEAVSDSGLFIVHRVDDEWFYEIPNPMLGREMLLVSRRARTAAELGYGGQRNNVETVRWQEHGDRILLRTVSYEVVAADSLPIFRAVQNATFEPIIRSFDIAAFNPDSSAVVIEVTGLFTEDVPVLGLSRETREEYEIRSLDEDRTFINWAKSFPENIEVRQILTYEAEEPPTNGATGTISLEMNHSMILLPADPMEPRLWDERVGYFTVEQVDYGRSDQQTETRRYITRWRLEPSDTAAWRRGELVEPVEPIVYYVDPATPMKWRPYLKQGIEDWQEAFEAAGFKNAIIARDPPSPEEDPDWSPEDVRYSVIRWFPSDIQNAYGPHVHDPRTGEILESDIGWFHNVMSLLRDWYFVQTAAANPDARAVRFDDELMGRLIRFVAAHEVGHTLGLPHNMKASVAYPVDSLRAPGFVCRMGVAPTIMDYARFNYVAQPDDEGACFLPRIGPYDRYAIRWGYRPIPGAGTADEEEDVLDGWIAEHAGDPLYQFGDRSAIDPTSLTEAIGTDAMVASRLGIENLKRIVPNLIEWTYRPSEDYRELEELYREVTDQWNRYMGHVIANIGGVVRTRKTTDQEGAVYARVPAETQERAVAFLAAQAFDPPLWMIDRDILRRFENAGAVEHMRELQVGVLDRVLEPGRMARLIEQGTLVGDSAYRLTEMMADVRDAVWSELGSGEPIETYRRNLQRGYLERMKWLMESEPEPPDSDSPAIARFFTEVDVPQSDIRAVVRGELQALDAQIRRALANAPDGITRFHLEDARVRIERILNPEE